MALRDSRDHFGIESLTLSGPPALLIEALRDFVGSLLVQQTIDLKEGLRGGSPALPGIQRARQRDRLCGAPSEADLDNEILLFDERHIFDQQANHALALSIRCLGILPERTKIRG